MVTGRRPVWLADGEDPECRGGRSTPSAVGVRPPTDSLCMVTLEGVMIGQPPDNKSLHCEGRNAQQSSSVR